MMDLQKKLSMSQSNDKDKWTKAVDSGDIYFIRHLTHEYLDIEANKPRITFFANDFRKLLSG